MYYNRTISNGFAKLLEDGGELRWLFDFVKNHEKLDFLIGKSSSKQWISVYYGLTRLISIRKFKDEAIFIDTADAYQKLSPKLYGKKNISDNFQKELEDLILEIDSKSQFDRYYKNQKEGYYQNILSRRYGICGKHDDDFVIIDKEAVVGYLNQIEKNRIFGNIQYRYKQLQKEISILNPELYGKDLEKKAIGNELDFLVLDKEGNILLMEYKHGTNTSGIYLSPLQIGLYYDIFSALPRNELEFTVREMLAQKQKIGLINQNWRCPETLKKLIPVLIISEYNYNSSGREKYNEILQFVRLKTNYDFLNNIQTYNFTLSGGLTKW